MYNGYLNLRELLKNKDEVNKIIKLTQFLDEYYPDKINIRQRLWHVKNDSFVLQKCRCCDNVVSWFVMGKDYRVHCSRTCSYSNPEVLKKRKDTCNKKYGHDTNLQCDSTQDKIKKTNLERYGVENPFSSEEIQDKIKKTNLERYGAENPSLSTHINDKINNTHMKQYGRKRSSQSHMSTDTIDKKNDKELMHKWHVTDKMSITEIADTLGIGVSQLSVHFKEVLGITVRRHNESIIEKQICEYLDTLGITYITSDRNILSPKEIDIYIPDENLAIEVDGIYWHTELRGKDRHYHINKTEACAEKGIRLIHIFSNEWINKQEVVKSRLASLLHKNNRVFARKTTVKLMFPDELKSFFNKSHIQGNAQASFGIGLVYEGEIVAAMSFGKSRFNKQIEWELIRYANALNTNVIGGASKLFKYFTELYKPNTIVSYSDKRWNTGDLYRKLGFTHTHSSGPNYFYTKNFLDLDARVKFQKHKLEKLLEHFDTNQTEWENMVNNGYDRIWDCGNDVFHWNLVDNKVKT